MIYLFDESKTLTGTVRDEHVRSLLYDREKNGMYDVSAEIPVIAYHQGNRYNLHTATKDAVFLGHYDLEGRFQLHKIAGYDVNSDTIAILGVHIFFDEAKAGAIIKDRRYIDREVSDGARDAFAEIGWQLADYDVSPRRTYNFYNVSPLEARATLIETFGFEFDYWIDFDGKKISGKYFSVKKQIGQDVGKRYTYDKHTNTGHHVLELTAETDYSEVFTAVIGRGKGEEIEDTGGYGRRIEYTDIAWSKPNDPLDKPRGSRVLVDPEATQAFGYVDGDSVKPRTAVVIFSDIEEQRELIEASYDWLVEHRQPKLLFDVEVADGDGLELGDTVHIKYNEISLNMAVRVGKVIDDLKSGERQVQLGDVAYFKPGRSNRDIKRSIRQERRDASNRIYQLKLEFDERFENEVQQIHEDYEQALIDTHAEIEAAEQRHEDRWQEIDDDINRNIEKIVGGNVDILDTNLLDINQRMLSKLEESDLEPFENRLTINEEGVDGLLTRTEENETAIGTFQATADLLSADFANYKQDIDSDVGGLSAQVATYEASVDGFRTDVGVLSSNVDDLESWRADRGSLFEQTADKVQQSVWLNDIKNIGANLIPMSSGSWEDGRYWSTLSEGVFGDNARHIKMKRDQSMMVSSDVTHTFSDESPYDSAISHWLINFTDYSEETPYGEQLNVPRGGSLTFIVPLGATRILLTAIAMDGFTVSASRIEEPNKRIFAKLEQGHSATPILPVLDQIEKRTDFILRPDGFFLGGKYVDGDHYSTAIVGSDSGLDILADEMRVSGDLLVKGDVESYAISAIHADLRSVNSEIMTSNIIKSNWIDVDTALFNRFTSSEAFIDRLEVQAANIRDLDVIDIHANTFSSTVPGSNREITMYDGRARFRYGSVIIETTSGRRTIIDGYLNRSSTLVAREPAFKEDVVDVEGQWFRVNSTYYRTAHLEHYIHEARYLEISVAINRWGQAGEIVDARAETANGRISNFFTSQGNGGDGTHYGWLEINLGEPLDRPTTGSVEYTFKNRHGLTRVAMHLGNRFLTDFPENR